MTAARFLKENLPAKTIQMRKDQGIQSPVMGGLKESGIRESVLRVWRLIFPHLPE